MKTSQLALRSSLAAAMVAVGVAAHAQNVTIYGIVDQGISKANSGTTPGSLLPGRASPDVWTLKAGNSSRIGFRGTEDLGDDAYARFQLEHRFKAETGAASSATIFWLGRSYVALGKKQWGEIYAGREYSPAFTVALNADPTYWSYVSQLALPYTYANWTPVASTIEAQPYRWSNEVGYKSPNWAGASFELATALGEGTRKRSTSGNVQYKAHGVWAAGAFDQIDSNNNLRMLAGGYDFGVVFPTAIYTKAKGGLNGDATSYAFAVRAPLPYGRVYAQYGHLHPAVANTDSAMVGAGTEYDLSKRTCLYANLGSAKRDRLTRTTAFDVGVKHTF